MNIIATTPQSIDEPSTDFGQFLEESSITFIPRQRKSLNTLMTEHDARGIIVWQDEGPVLYIDDAKFFFHPSMGKNRIVSFRKLSALDPLVRACDIKENSSLLDCTMGLGADAIVASYFAGGGKTTGLESSRYIAYMVKWGMKLYNSKMTWLNEAIRRIEVINTDHLKFLRNTEDNSYDTVYFDPMFRRPQLKSQAISPLRLLANHDPLTIESIAEACRVAKKRVVVKEMRSSLEFDRLGITKIMGSPNKPISYGIIEV